MTNQLTAHLENWSVAHFGPPLDVYVLVGIVTGHHRLDDGEVAVTSDVCLLATDLSHAITNSSGRRYSLGQSGDITVKGLKMLAYATSAWRISNEVHIRINVNPQEISGRPLIDTGARH